MPSVSFKTFGCKLNQAETAMLAEQFGQRGYEILDPGSAADVAVIHTCTVTGRSDAKCRQAVHHALRLNPRTTVIVAGCYPQVAAGELASIPGVDYVVGSRDKFALFEVFHGPGKRTSPVVAVSGRPETALEAAPEARPGRFDGRTRAFLKVQSGCSRRCSYCIVPDARGPGRSEPFDAVLRNAEALVRRGFVEVVVTGTHIGDYGKDTPGSPRFPELMARLAGIDGLLRLRMSSLDPDELTDEVVDVVARHDKICRHFHVPLQSGSDAVLASMRRPYTASGFAERVGILTDRFGAAGLGTDVITGFPGETEARFQETLRFVESMPFTYLHVFPFSPRPGTAAASMPDPVPAGLRLERARILRSAGSFKRRAFAEASIGRVVTVLVESADERGGLSGWTGEYLRVRACGGPAALNRIVSVAVKGAAADGTAAGVIVPGREESGLF
jgi:threonylcarbamoyladenosine tRNA methylthiotransferase MtaB